MGMRSLSKKLKSLEASVQTTQESTAGKSAPTAVLHDLSALQARLNGQWWGHSEGQVLYAEEIFPVSMTYGRSKVHLSTSLQQLSRWLGLETLATTPLEQMLFLDTETTGLAGGAGTYAFMVGLGWFTEAGFCLRQFFLRDPSEENEFLQVLAEQFVNKTLLVTFNGKSYDVPLLRNRFALKKQPFSLDSLDHLDLLTLARRLWSNRLPSRRLRALESEILGVERSEEDIEGHLIPDVYFGFLKNGEVGQLPQVFHHNKMDIVAMVALLEHIAWMAEEPLDGRIPHAEDLASIAMWLEQQKHIEEAIALYDACLQGRLPEELRQKVMERFALLKKRDEDWNAAVALWIINATKGSIDSHIELAKYHEHRTKNIDEALHWTQKAIKLLRTPKVPRHLRFRWWDPLEHRRDRLLRKQKGLPVEEDESPDSLIHPARRLSASTPEPTSTTETTSPRTRHRGRSSSGFPPATRRRRSPDKREP